ncbi:hepatocyte nuclear factor 1-alpha [Brachyhypopomus gauderio]|uniref:hepatocyte nuclear factor 1-alpha n=1 Tax=Brachyhypopomus gauderio TaxID=698409 RepID=UPI00404344B0
MEPRERVEEGLEEQGVRELRRSRTLTALQEQLVWSLLGSGLSRDVLLQAIEELERSRGQRADRADGESSEEGEMDYPPPIYRELEKLHPDEAARQRTQVEQLLQEDPWRVAKMVKSYMQQHNLPQREVVESTGLNQSHLSQHLNKGTPMKNQKRAALYSWYVKKQDEISQQFTNASRGVEPGEEPGEDGRKGRRNRFKWGPASQQILFQAYERQKNPSKEEREGLVEECNRAECLQRGVSPSQLAGLGSNLVTEVRVYNWFANRRKEEAFRHKLALDTPYSSQSTSIPVQTLPFSSTQASVKFPQPVMCDGLGVVRSSGEGDRTSEDHLETSPVQLEPSHTLLDTPHHKPVSGGGPLPPVSTLTSLHGISCTSPQGLIMATLPSVMSLGDSSLLIGLTPTQPQAVPVINSVGGGFTTLQPISFQQQLHTSPPQPITQPLQAHMGPGSFMSTMAQLPSHMYGKTDLASYAPTSLLSQAMVIADSSSIGALSSLSSIRQTLTSGPEEHTHTPIQEESLHLQSSSPVPVSSGDLELYSQTQANDTHSTAHLLTSPPPNIDRYIPGQMVSTTQ